MKDGLAGFLARMPSVREAPATLNAQREKMLRGLKPAMLFTDGEAQAPFFGFGSTCIPEGVVHYNPDMLTESDVLAASDAGRLNDILGMGPFSKADVLARVLDGDQPLSLVERGPGGEEVLSIAATRSTLPTQIDYLNQYLSPGNVLSVENPEEVIRGRYGAF